MGWWSTLFNSTDTIAKTTDAIISAGDKLFYTDEEKADMKIEQARFMPTLLKAYEPFKIAQRILALWFSFLFGIAFITGLGMVIFNIIVKYQQLKSGVKIDQITVLDLEPLIHLIGAFSLPMIMGLILTWYFGGGFVESFKRTKSTK